jgi:hypothetical protein
MSNIPLYVQIMKDAVAAFWANDIDGETLAEVFEDHADLLYRTPPVRKAAPSALGWSGSIRRQIRLRDRIKAFAAENPDMPLRDIGRALGTDGGRVSEALTGKKDNLESLLP